MTNPVSRKHEGTKARKKEKERKREKEQEKEQEKDLGEDGNDVTRKWNINDKNSISLRSFLFPVWVGQSLGEGRLFYARPSGMNEAGKSGNRLIPLWL